MLAPAVYSTLCREPARDFLLPDITTGFPSRSWRGCGRATCVWRQVPDGREATRNPFSVRDGR